MTLVAAALALVLASGAAAADLVYLHVEANEGGSSGGHVALRVGDDVYHYQHEAPGVLRLARDAADRFEQQYRLTQNRTIHATHVTVDDETLDRIGEELTRRHRIGVQQRACRAALAADVALLAAMDGEPIAVRVDGLGFFADDGAEEPALAAVRTRDLAVRSATVRRRLAALRYEAFAAPPPPTDDDGRACYGFAGRYADELAMLRALDVLSSARPLRADAVRTVDLPLRADERAVVAAHRDALAQRLPRLVASDRPGTGFALLVGMARLVALTRTLDEHRWVLLDAYPSDAPTLDAAHHRDAVDALIPRARHDVDVARAAFVERGVDGGETALGDVETAANRLAELLAARDDGRPLRIHSGALVPSRAAPAGMLPSIPPGVRPSLASAHARRDAWDEAFVALHRYQLVTRNCVTELFAAMDAVTGTTARGPLAFIPFIAADALAGTVREERPSYRRLRLAALPDATSRLREATTVTATIYRPNPDDSVFLFFTDDVVAPRPLFGLANLAVGLGAGVAGLVTLPVDRGALLRAGFWGAVWSLPELLFVNIRKGTFALPQPAFTSNTSTSAAVRATSETSPSSTTAAPSPASSDTSPS